MLKNYFLLFYFILIFYFNNAFAETPLTCPSIYSVHHSINIWPSGEWLPEYVNNEELAAQQDIDEFIATATRFTKAEWSGDYQEMAHCFYNGDDKIVLARNMLKPNMISNPFWHRINKKLLRCKMRTEDACNYGGIG